MNPMLAASCVGFLLGMRHATDPDHLVAVSTLVARTRRLGASWFLGACWGLGHTFTIFAAGAAVILLRWAVSPRAEAAMEFAVGAMLVVLGTLSLRDDSVRRWGLQEHSHEHGHDDAHGHHLLAPGGDGHSHPHLHSAALEALSAGASAGGRTPLRAFAVGTVHGLAGSGAVALLVLAAIPGTAAQLAYLAVFGLGTLVGMMFCSTAMELAMLWAQRRWDLGRGLSWGFGAASAAFGCYIMLRQGGRIWTGG